MPRVANRVCANHPQRSAFAVCMTCKKAVCQECATQWDGIYHCASCLTAQRKAMVRRSPVLGWMAVLLLSLILLFAGAHLMVWTGVLIAGLF